MVIRWQQQLLVSALFTYPNAGKKRKLISSFLSGRKIFPRNPWQTFFRSYWADMDHMALPGLQLTEEVRVCYGRELFQHTVEQA
jgi:hypothetical protein